MPQNDADYPSGKPAQPVLIGALGFETLGHRGGGIETPIAHLLPKDTVLLRFHRPAAPGGNPGDFGEWWFTPHEYRRICDRFGVDGQALAVGRAGGKSVLHGVLALLNEWYGNNPNQLSLLNAVKLSEPLWACYGSGAPANAAGYARTLKPVKMNDGKSARQVYIHKCWQYQSAMTRLLAANATTDSTIGSAQGLPANIINAPRLSFEV